jgi:DNA-binding transcriptional ArsR family regulator
MRAGIVEARREGTSAWYSVTEPEVFALLDAARAILRAAGGGANRAAGDAIAESVGD